MSRPRDGAGAGGPRVSRRRFVGGLGAGIGSLAVGGAAGGLIASAVTGGDAGALSAAGVDSQVAFHGEHQAGIVTPAQQRLVFASMNMTSTSRSDLRDLLRTWTPAAAAMTRGEAVPGSSTDPTAAPADTGEAAGLDANNLTVTIGFGPSLFDDRFGLAAKRPAALVDLPSLPNEDLDPDHVGGDLCIQACADDPVVAFHAVRNLARLGFGVVEHNWLELGFGQAASTSRDQSTPRNLLGFKDGTRNLKSDQTDLLDEYAWVGDETDQAWMKGGSYLVARRIQMFLENWDRDYLADQENVIGRAKHSGAPLGETGEFDPPDFHRTAASGLPVIPADAHIRLAAHENNGGLRILRRGYSYTDGIDPVRGTLLGGLFFIAFMKDPAQFVTLQRKLGAHDALNEYISHTGSGLFACPPGVQEGQHWGQQLFD